MSSHRAARNDQRDTGSRRIAIATTASAVGGTALAVLFGTVFAQGAAAPAATIAPLVDAAKAELAPAAVSAPETKAGVPTTATPSVPGKNHRSTPTTTLRPPSSAPTKAPEPEETKAAEPTHASTGAS